MKLCLHVRICPGGARQLASLPELDLAAALGRSLTFAVREAEAPPTLSWNLEFGI